MGKKHKVIIIQRILPHYRLPFFLKLHDELLRNGISLELLYGQEYPGSVPKTFGFNESWAKRIDNRYLKIGKLEFVWQPIVGELTDSNLIIVEQANRLLLNYLLLFRIVGRKSKIAYWGHGRNVQAEGRKRFREYIKRKLTTTVDWCFAYTEISSNYVESLGYPKGKITVTQNTIDTKVFDKDLSSVNEQEISELKQSLGINSENICIYCGGIYREKKIDFLIESCIDIKKIINDFHIIIIGSGPLDYVIKEVSDRYQWIHYLGPVMGRAKAKYFKMSKAILMPGLVGLAIVDSFVASVPLITTDIKIHSPEISYLKNGKNGIMTSFSKEDYVKSVVNYLRSKELQEILRAGCLRSADKYSMDNMINKFKNGIMDCLFGVN